ncbi:MAG: glycoside hydrolase family 13 [Planctomycetes bacterium]|nr:glycoside hydrolase family 13 [Planctomycetota bacterium]MBI3833415.1 glycoside hydrolase family 13 [Planctomycetota bacterium]
MLKSPSKSTTTPTATRLTCLAPDAQRVFVAGTFNDWNPAAQAMTKGPDGDWAAELCLPPGRYEYKFHVDGVWCCEPHLCNDGHPTDDRVANPFGTMNRVLLVQ